MIPNGTISRKLPVKSQNQDIFRKFRLNQNLRRISLNLMYYLSMLRHCFSNERGEGGGEEWRAEPFACLPGDPKLTMT